MSRVSSSAPTRCLFVLALAACSDANPLFDVDVDVDAVAEVREDGPSGEAAFDAGAEVITGPDVAVLDGARSETPDGTPCFTRGCPPLLHWRFDEPSGTVAGDASGHGFDGLHVGDPTLPQSSTSVPLTSFGNPRSLQFPASGKPAVRLPDGVGRLGLTTTDQLTVCGWFRATAAAATGGDVVNVADSLLLRIKPTQIELAKRVSNDPGSSYVVAVFLGSSSYLDGRWHHLAGVMGSAGLALYVDGVVRVMDPVERALIFVAREVWVGRREMGATNNFQGGIDDVRLYRRALAADEIQEMAAGTR